MNRGIVLIGTIVATLSLVGSGNSKIWYVHPDSALNSIQAGLNSCSTGDTVLVAPSTYYEHISWPSTNGIKLLSESGPGSTIIDGGGVWTPGPEYVVYESAAGIDSGVINGFTIQNNQNGIYCKVLTVTRNIITKCWLFKKRAIRCDGGSPVIKDNTIIDNYWGIDCNGGSPIIEGNTITSNIVEGIIGSGSVTITHNTISHNGKGDYGSGIYWVGGSPAITDNIITDNNATLDGGGLWVSTGSPVISRNIISGNWSGRKGGGIYVTNVSSGNISGNIITDNSASDLGGGILCWASSLSITDNVISGNGLPWRGGGIACIIGSSPMISKNTISANDWNGIYCENGSQPEINYNNITDNTSYGLRNVDASVIIDAECNWWGDPTGPGGVGPGSGDEVSDYVDYDPWLTAPSEELSIKTTSLQDGFEGITYCDTLEASGGILCGVTHYTWSIISKGLPPGLSLEDSTGIISGIPTSSGTFNFTAKVQDADSPPNTATKSLSITIVSIGEALTITTSWLPDGAVSVSYSEALSATGGEEPYTWSIEGGELPPGLALNPSAGVISGIPTTHGTYNFTVKVTDSDTSPSEDAKDLSIKIKSAPPLTITTVALPDGWVGTFYSHTLTAIGGVIPYTWEVTMGNLPPGLGLDYTGVISGIPTVERSFSFIIKVTDSGSPPSNAYKNLSIHIWPTPYPDLQVVLVEGPVTAQSGQTIEVSWTVTNNGTEATDAPLWYDGVYLSLDHVFGTDDISLGKFMNSSDLSAGESYVQMKEVTIPGGICGPYYLLVVTDCDNHVDEHTGEGNNTGSSDVINVEYMILSLDSSEVFTVVHGGLSMFGIDVPDIDNLFILLKKTTHIGHSGTWSGSLKLLKDGTQIAFDSGSMDFDIHVQDPEPGLYTIEIQSNRTAEGIIKACSALPDLPLGEWKIGTIYRPYGYDWFQLDVPPGQTSLFLQADGIGLWNTLEIYHGYLENNTEYWRVGGYYSYHIEYEIENPPAGRYYLRYKDSAVLRGTADQTRDYMIFADTEPIVTPPPLAPTITDLSTYKGGTAGPVTIIISGAGLDSAATVSLVRAGYPDIVATDVFGDSTRTTLTATFDLSGAATGEWTLKVTNPDGQSATAPTAFSIEENEEIELWVDIIGRDQIRMGRWSTCTISYGNSGNTDAICPILWVRIPDSYEYVLELLPYYPVNEDETAYLDTILIMPYKVLAGTKTDFPIRLRSFDTSNGTIEAGFFIIPPELLGLDDGLFKQRKFNIEFSDRPQPGDIVFRTFTYPFDFEFPSHDGIYYEDENKIGWVVDFREDGKVHCLLYESWKIENGLNTYIGHAHFPNMTPGIGKQIAKDAFDRYMNGETGRYWALPDNELFFDNCNTWISKRYRDHGIYWPFHRFTPPIWIFDLWGNRPSEVSTEPRVFAINEADVEKYQGTCQEIVNDLDRLVSKYFQVVYSTTPEDKYGPTGYDAPNTPIDSLSRFVSADQTFSYRIDFWNKEDATAPAQDVFVVDTLDVDFDFSTLSFTEFGFLRWIIPLEGGQYFNVDVDMRPDMDLIVNVEGTFEPSTGAIAWTFLSLDPTTRQPPEDPMAGFLPPIDSTGYQIGWVDFSVAPLSDLPSGTQITNQAFVNFDGVGPWNPAPKEAPYLNTIDALPPTSNVRALPDSVTTLEFEVHWLGSDDSLGSGIRNYTIYVSDNENLYTPWLSNTTDTSATFFGDNYHTYSLYSIATDNVGNKEAAPTTADATTFVAFDTESPSTPVLIHPPDSSLLTDRTPTFIWHKSTDDRSGVAKYEIMYANNDSFANPYVEYLTDTTYTPPCSLTEDIYYWVVRAIDKTGNHSFWSTKWYFTYDSEAPSPPTLVSPIGGTWLNGTLIVFQWTEVSSLLKYNLSAKKLIREDGISLFSKNEPNFLSIDTPIALKKEAREEVQDLHVSRKADINFFPGHESTSFAKRIKEKDIISLTQSSVKRDIGPISKGKAVAFLGKKTQGEASIIVGTPVTYILQVDTLPSFLAPLVTGTLTVASDTLVLKPGIYYWRVRAYDEAGNQGEFSNPDSFGIDMTPPVLSGTTIWSDTNFQGPYGVSSIIVDNLSGIDSVFLYYRFDPDTAWNSIPMQIVDSDTFEAEIPEVADTNTTIYYYLEARDLANNASFDPPGGRDSAYSFVGWYHIYPPVPISPSDSSFTNDDTPTFCWSKVTNATIYQIQVDADSSFSSLDIDSILTDSTYTPMSTLDGTTYYWHVRAGNIWSNWTSTLTFTIDTKAPKVTVISPNGAESLKVNSVCTIKWIATDENGVDSLSLFWSLDGGADWDTIATGEPNDSSYSWAPDTTSDKCLIKIIAFDPALNTGEDVSDSLFVTTGVEEFIVAKPTTYALYENLPNPFTLETTIHYQLPVEDNVNLRIYSLSGQLVRTLADEWREAGYYKIIWDGRDDAGQRTAPGVYFYRLQSGNYTSTRKMILLR